VLFAVDVASSFLKVGDVDLYILFSSLEQFFWITSLMACMMKVVDKAGIL
jgi:hypothetical protein